MTDPLSLTVLLGSNRSPRLCDAVAGWALDHVARDARFQPQLIDPRTAGLPDTPGAPQHPAVARLDAQLARADAFLVITPEYNHGYPAALKQLIDAAWAPWQAKPVGFVAYGGHSGGLRAVEQLRQVFLGLHAVPVPDAVMLADAHRQFGPDGPAQPPATAGRAMAAMLAQLHWWSAALRDARTRHPYRRTTA